MENTNIKKLTQQLNSLLEEAVGRQEIAGANLLVLKDGEELLYTQAGHADIAQKRPYQRDTVVRLYSMTKPITAVAAMLLVAQGKLDMGAPVEEFLPAFRKMQVWEGDHKVPARRSILIKDLLNMTSGLAYPGEDAAGQEVGKLVDLVNGRLDTNIALTTAEVANAIADCGLAFHPGESWRYGTSADVLGAVIEQASGMPYDKFLQESLFEPLCMKQTAFYVPQERQHRLAEIYESVDGELHRYSANHLGVSYTMRNIPAFLSGGAGLTSTIDDYAQFAAMLMRGGEPVLSRKSVAMLEQSVLAPWQQMQYESACDGIMQGHTYGSLMRHLVVPGAATHCGWQGEYGWDGWLGTYFCNSPQNGVTVLMTMQRVNAGTISVTRKIRNVLYANL